MVMVRSTYASNFLSGVVTLAILAILVVAL